MRSETIKRLDGEVFLGPSHLSGPVAVVLLAVVALAGCSREGISSTASQPRESSSGAQAQSAPPDPHFRLAGQFRTSTFTADVGRLVGIVQIGRDEYLVCDYVSVWQFKGTGSESTSVRLVSPPRGVEVWNPAGLFLDKAKGLLYVANYHDHSVLALNYDRQDNALSLRRRIVAPCMISPENVAVDAKGNVLVADYDGSGLLKFDESGTLLWRVEVRQAHGLATRGDVVYATSLTDRCLMKFDSQGRILAKQGALGIAPGQYLWPVSVAAVSGDRMAVVDPQTGRITVLSRDLDLIEVHGGNGPGVDLLNYPYAIIPADDGTLVADTFRRRLIAISSTWEIQRQIVHSGRVPTARSLAAVSGTPSEPYTYPDLEGLDVRRMIGVESGDGRGRFVGGFNALHGIGDDGRVTVKLALDAAGKRPFGASERVYYHWYMMWALSAHVDGRPILLIGSPQRNAMLVVDVATGASTEAPLPLDCWCLKSTIVGSNETKYDPAKLAQDAVRNFARLDARLAQGESRGEAYRRVFFGSLSRTDFTQKVVRRELSFTPAGSEFYQAMANGGDMETAAAKYFRGTSAAAGQEYLREILLVKYLAGSRFRQPNQKTITEIDRELPAEP